MSNKKYWKSLEDYNNSPEFVKGAMNEFAEPIPVDEFLGNENLDSTKTPRRDFLKFLGFSVTAASLAACSFGYIDSGSMLLPRVPFSIRLSKLFLSCVVVSPSTVSIIAFLASL